jgi:hypothetical protein
MKKTIGRFLNMHQELARRVADSRGLDVRRTKVQSPFASWIWYPLGLSFDLAWPTSAVTSGKPGKSERRF